MTLRERRTTNGLTQKCLAQMLEIDQAAVSRWESGETRPARKYQVKLAALYGCTVDEIMRGADAAKTGE